MLQVYENLYKLDVLKMQKVNRDRSSIIFCIEFIFNTVIKFLFQNELCNIFIININMESEPEEVFKITSLTVSPDKSKIEDGIKIDLKFVPVRDWQNTSWRLMYVIDTSKKRLVLNLYTSENTETYSKGEDYEWNFKWDDISLEGVKKKYLLNTGLLVLEAAENADFDSSVIIKINMMVMISEDKASGGLSKHIIYEND